MSARRSLRVGELLLAVLGVVAAACGSTGDVTDETAPPAPPSSVVATAVPSTPLPSDPPASSVRERLAVLVVDDRPLPTGSYRRDDWPHWEDVDGNGCDARQDTLVRWSTTPPQMDPSRRCKVLAGTWSSPYDGAPASTPSTIEIDHLVPLAEAFRSGGWRWGPEERRRFANDPLELVAASSSSNGAKSDSRPDEWRPRREEAWCAYADRWVEVKAGYGLSVTTSERDALGQMLDTCAATSERWP